ncbi:MAG: hypothetical protein IT422_20865 [Pirellulaceae bacterium]|nr:hypothetical protein [Pirellulaceae bacterium]
MVANWDELLKLDGCCVQCRVRVGLPEVRRIALPLNSLETEFINSQ